MAKSAPLLKVMGAFPADQVNGFIQEFNKKNIVSNMTVYNNNYE